MVDMPRVVAHRGASVEAPENTMAAFRRALDLGCRAIELDVHLSADGVPVVIHDDTLDRTTDGEGPVVDRSLAELKELSAGAWFGSAFADERIPTLAEVFDLAIERDALLNLELKTDQVDYPGLERAVGDLAREKGVLDRVFVSSFNPATVQRFHALHPDVGTGVIVVGEVPPEDAARYAKFARVLGLYVACVTPEAVAAAHDAKLDVVAWVVNAEDVARHVLALGASGVITDDPRALAALL